ncbi:STAS domain-containing protein [Dactylosporangium sp. CA-092794]|uniref:STAS domain-containing protein n=1 Tax=Dactylosporangium sp. CA-092794 TaxID=3239929 RepID=UPI003D9040E8
MDSQLVTEQTALPGEGGGLRVVVRLLGVVDLATEPRLRQALDRALAVPGAAEIVVDLDRLTLLDSTGIAALVSAYRSAAAQGAVLSVANAQGMVRRVLEITGVLKTLTE